MGCKPSKTTKEMDTGKAMARFELLRSLCSNVSTVEKKDETKDVSPPLSSKEYPADIEIYRRKMEKKKEKNRELFQPEDNTLFEISTRIKEQNFDE